MQIPFKLILFILISTFLSAKCISGNCSDGYGTFRFESGNEYEGYFENNIGHGFGTYSFQNGEKHVGEYKLGEYSGFGIYSWPDGENYVGEFKNDDRNGFGIYTFANKNNKSESGIYKDDKLIESISEDEVNFILAEKYSKYFYLLYLSQDPGCKIGDCSNGKGIYYFSNGDIYIGFHKNDQRHDTGKYIWSDGDLYEGEWYNNQQEGLGEFQWGNGDFFEGEYVDAQANGYGIVIYKNGDYLSGIWDNDIIIEEISPDKVFNYLEKNYPDFYAPEYIEFMNDCTEGELILRRYCDCAVDQLFSIYIEYEGNYNEERYIELLEKNCTLYLDEYGLDIPTENNNNPSVNYCEYGDCVNGYGKYIYENGDIYEGDFRNSEKHGSGTLTWHSNGSWGGDIFSGIFKYNKYVEGKYTFSNGNVYEGSFNDKYRYHGYGKLTFSSGVVWEGKWIDGEFQGSELIYEINNAYDYNKDNLTPHLNDNFGDYHALILAADNYKYDREYIKNSNYSQYSQNYWPDLDGYPIKESKELINVLEEYYGFRSENITFIQNPKRDDIIESLEYYKQILDPTDNLLILFSGHGNYIQEDRERGFWIPVNGKPTSRTDWVSNSDVKDIIAGIPANNILLITDACYSGAIFTSKSSRSIDYSYVEDSHKAISKIAMTAGAIETVPGKSVFIEEIISTLLNNSNQFISSKEIYDNIYTPVVEGTSGNKPQWGIIVNENTSGDFIFVKSNKTINNNYNNKIELFKKRF